MVDTAGDDAGSEAMDAAGHWEAQLLSLIGDHADGAMVDSNAVRQLCQVDDSPRPRGALSWHCDVGDVGDGMRTYVMVVMG